MLKFSENSEFSKEKFRKIPILKEFEWFEWFEWFGPSPIEPFNSARHRRVRRSRGAARLRRAGLRRRFPEERRALDAPPVAGEEAVHRRSPSRL